MIKIAVIKIKYTSRFVKKLKKLPRSLVVKAAKKEKLFKKDPFTLSLKTHALTGKLQAYHAFSVDYHTRIMFKFVSEEEVVFLDIGTHSIYKI